ncbi:MAG: hypothetical protein K0041_08875, partial [Acidithiobacillus sp.]|nr:hypothetical protein [Acidithiobacillus sp.]
MIRFYPLPSLSGLHQERFAKIFFLRQDCSHLFFIGYHIWWKMKQNNAKIVSAMFCLALAGTASAEAIPVKTSMIGDSVLQNMQLSNNGNSLSLQVKGSPSYSVHSLNDGYRVRIDFQGTHIANSMQSAL